MLRVAFGRLCPLVVHWECLVLYRAVVLIAHSSISSNHGAVPCYHSQVLCFNERPMVEEVVCWGMCPTLVLGSREGARTAMLCLHYGN